jgi:hypothetical protein
MEKEHSSSRSSTKGARSNYTALQPWHDCFIKVGCVYRCSNHGATASSKSAVWIHINTMVRLLHQCRSCGPYATVYNHVSTALSKSAMRSLQDHQPWLDRTTNVGHVELKSSTVLAVLDHPHGMLDSVLHLQCHRPTDSSISAIYHLVPG